MTGDTKASRDSAGAGFDASGPISPGRALAPAVVRLNERRVAAGFWPKFRRVASRIPFAGEALSVWFCARDEETPPAAKGMMLAALAYFVLPTDAVPDFVAGLGFTDDAAVFAALMAVVGRNLKSRHRDAARSVLEKMRRGE